MLGILDRTYILASGRRGLVMIDQHAAHERIMFEKLLDEAKGNRAPTQALLLPQTLELPQPMCSLLLRYRKLFEMLGFDIEPMGSNTVMLNGLPASMVTHRPLEELIPDMLQELLENQGDKIPVELEYVARAACRAAIKDTRRADAGTGEGAAAPARRMPTGNALSAWAADDGDHFLPRDRETVRPSLRKNANFFAF
ncbi:MAG: hypothetical protein L6W00_29925 [Lentisphaeria bacterium]|nr:MAG: hypothetical protein L6W00_29925 [Lentisphaeria bacterium]